MSEAVDPVALLEPAAARVRDPHSGKSVLLANIVRNARMDDTRLRFDLAFTPAHTKEERKAIEEAILLNLRELGFHGQVFPFSRLDGTAPTPPKPKADIPGLHHAGGVAPHGGAIVKMKLEGVQHVVCVASGKGGVGKSTVAANLAIALQREGKKVGTEGP